MADIQEIPLDNTDIAEDIPDIAEDIPDVAVEVPEKPIKPKAKGRPRGSCNKGPSKPRDKKKLKYKRLP